MLIHLKYVDDVNLKINNGSKSNHDYDQVPPELNLSGMHIYDCIQIS